MSATPEEITESGMPPSTNDIPLESLEAYNLLDSCPLGFLPNCIQRQPIYTSSSNELPSSNPNIMRSIAAVARPPYPLGTRMRFHFRTTTTEKGVLIDDTRHGVRPRPMELISGRGFILEIWEIALNTMKEDEVVRFMVPKELCLQYPMVAQVMRNVTKNRKWDHPTTTKGYLEEVTGNHFSLDGSGSGFVTGYQDLDDFLTSPVDLTFILELLEVSLPGEYMLATLYNAPLLESTTTVEKPPVESEIPFNDATDLEEFANLAERKADKLLVSKDYESAGAKYAEALSKITQLGRTEETDEEQRKRISILMKAAYCQLNRKDYIESQRLLSSVLEINPDNPVALFRRGRSNVQTGNFKQARRDFERTLELDPTYQKAVKSEIAIVESEERKTSRI